MKNSKLRQFLIKLAVDKYNDQYGTNLLYESFTIYSIDPNYNTDLGYELVTTNQLDFVRLRLYLLFDQNTIFSDYRVENDTQTGHGVLTDEVFVTLSTLSTYYRDEKIYQFTHLDEEDQWDVGMILLEDGGYLLDENGQPIQLEGY